VGNIRFDIVFLIVCSYCFVCSVLFVQHSRIYRSVFILYIIIEQSYKAFIYIYKYLHIWKNVRFRPPLWWCIYS